MQKAGHKQEANNFISNFITLQRNVANSITGRCYFIQTRTRYGQKLNDFDQYVVQTSKSGCTADIKCQNMTESNHIRYKWIRGDLIYTGNINTQFSRKRCALYNKEWKLDFDLQKTGGSDSQAISIERLDQFIGVKQNTQALNHNSVMWPSVFPQSQ